jgi:hypothetical protein
MITKTKNDFIKIRMADGCSLFVDPCPNVPFSTGGVVR